MTVIKIKPLSVNKAWKGRRYKTQEYKNYEKTLLWTLPRIKIPDPPYFISYIFGFSSSLSDADNPVKPFQDVISKKYGFNDKLIKKFLVEVKDVKKGEEFVEFKIETLKK